MSKSNYFVVEKPMLDMNDQSNLFDEHRFTTNNVVGSNQRSLLSALSTKTKPMPHAKPSNAPLAQKIIKKEKQVKKYMMDTTASRKKVLASAAKLRATKPETTYREKAKLEAQNFFSAPQDIKVFESNEFDGADEPVACEQSIVEQVIFPDRILR